VDELSASSNSLMRILASGALLALVVATFVTVSSSGQGERDVDSLRVSPLEVVPANGFGGYVLKGNVRDVQAQWQVPVISPTSPPGTAATWIGAQGTSGKGFIQIGVNELVPQQGEDFYEAFWSDTAVKFQPQPLGALSSGETLHASMKRDKSGWQISLRNGSRSFSVSRHISFGAGVDYTLAQWLQEDPTSGLVVTQDVPYPVMTNVRFTHLAVNGAKPRLSLRDAQVLITSTGEIDVPTPVRDNSFTFSAPHGAQRQYLEDARLLDRGSAAFQAQYANWKATSARLRLTDTRHWIDTLVLLTKDFETQSWPTPTQKEIPQLVLVTQHQIADLHSWLAAGLAVNGPAYLKFEGTFEAHQKSVNLVRASLRLPPV